MSIDYNYLNRLKPPLGTPLDRSNLLSKGLLGCWLMNEGRGMKTYDSSDNQNTGAMQSNTSWQIGDAYLPSGGSSYIYLKSVGPLEAFTCIVRCNIISHDTYGGIVWNGPWQSSFGMTVEGSSNQIVLYKKKEYVNTGYALPLSEFKHLCYVYDGAQLILYVDGVYKVSQSSSGTVAKPSIDKLYIGDRPSAEGGREVKGYFSYMMLWERALSADEIRLLYISPYQMFQQRGLYIPTSEIVTTNPFFYNQLLKRRYA